MALGVHAAGGVAAGGKRRLANLVHGLDQSLSGLRFVFLWLSDGGLIAQRERGLVQQREVSTNGASGPWRKGSESMQRQRLWVSKRLEAQTLAESQALGNASGALRQG